MSPTGDSPGTEYIPWKSAMHTALYGLNGFYHDEAGPAAHFRTSTHVSDLLARALIGLIIRVDATLHHPDPFEVVDVGAGRGELIQALKSHIPNSLRPRIQLHGVDLAQRPPGIDHDIGWSHTIPICQGLLIANEWLDNIPIDLAECDETGAVRTMLVDPHTGQQQSGGPLPADDLRWLHTWWPINSPGRVAEIGQPRDRAWAHAVSSLRAGLALAIDYGHYAANRPASGSLSGYRHGKQVEPVPDGTCDITASVAMDSVAAAGEAAGAHTIAQITQRQALHNLGLRATRPPYELARTDPTSYIHALSDAGNCAELMDESGLGGFWWLIQTVALPEQSVFFSPSGS